MIVIGKWKPLIGWWLGRRSSRSWSIDSTNGSGWEDTKYLPTNWAKIEIRANAAKKKVTEHWPILMIFSAPYKFQFSSLDTTLLSWVSLKKTDMTFPLMMSGPKQLILSPLRRRGSINALFSLSVPAQGLSGNSGNLFVYCCLLVTVFCLDLFISLSCHLLENAYVDYRRQFSLK